MGDVVVTAVLGEEVGGGAAVGCVFGVQLCRYVAANSGNGARVLAVTKKQDPAAHSGRR